MESSAETNKTSASTKKIIIIAVAVIFIVI